MSGDIVSYRGGALGAAIINGVGAEDPFEIVIMPAKPVLNALIEMRKPLAWLNQQRRSGRPIFHPNRAVELIDVIPNGDRIARAGALFLVAEEQPAPEQWLHVALGVMLDSEPGAVTVPDAFRCAITDGAYRDPAVWEHYDEPGFSCAVVVQAIREARLQGALPSPGGFLKLCIKHRRQFRTWNADISTLLNLRWEAEDALEKIDPKRLLLDYNPDDEVPF
jgi:hypothetical protein